MRSKSKLPIIFGMNPPTKEVMLIKTEKPLKGYTCLVFHADFPERIQSNQHIELLYKDMKRKGLATWLHFKDKETMKRFAQDLIDFADMEGEE